MLGGSAGAIAPASMPMQQSPASASAALRLNGRAEASPTDRCLRRCRSQRTSARNHVPVILIPLSIAARRDATLIHVDS